MNELFGYQGDKIFMSDDEDMATPTVVSVFSNVEVGSYVKLIVADEDRGRSDPPTILCRVVDYDHAIDKYEFCCRTGISEKLYDCARLQ